jgi:hypothetical protein
VFARRRNTTTDNFAVMEAALSRTLGVTPEYLEKTGTDERIIDAAESKQYRGIGIKQILRAFVQAGGRGNVNIDGNELIREAFTADRQMQAGGFTTISLPGIFSNSANKYLLQSFNSVEQVWRLISARKPVKDFKSITSYRLAGDATFEELPADGEIKHGTLTESSFTNRVKTYAKMFALTRVDMINDDLSALAAITKKLGRGAALKLNSVFWATWLADTTFFDTGNANGNYISGGTTNLSIEGLTAAEKSFLRQTDEDGNALAVTPKILLVPPDLKAIAKQLNASVTVNSGGASTEAQILNANPFSGEYVVATSAYLSNTTAWYLLADPNDLAAIEVAFLDGVETPTVESGETDFDTLGMAFRGFWDFGCAFVEPRAALKSKGAA